MATKLKIDLSQGILEVEGSETFVKAIYSDFKAHFVGNDTGTEDFLAPTNKRRRTKTTKRAAATPVKPSQAVSQTPIPVDASETQLPAPVESETEIKILPSPEPEPKVVVAKPDYTFIEELDLRAANGRPSLVEFMDAKFPITNEERNLVFLHYLQYTLSLKDITIHHIYTCYKAAKIRAPHNIENSLRATADQHHLIKIGKNGQLSLTQAGKLYVEKQLPKRIKS
jgi:hypothetical protein